MAALNTTDKLFRTISSFSKSSSRSRIVVSVCSGRSEIEMNSTDLCVCLDIDKRVLFAGKFASHYRGGRSNNVIFHYHDMRDGLLKILSSIHSSTDLPVFVLFQHPSPTSNKLSCEGLATASSECISALRQNFIEGIHFVYDCHLDPKKTQWKGDSLKNLSLSECGDTSDLLVSDTKIICDTQESTVEHPVFGTVPRCGWALLKRGIEKSFAITKRE